MSRYDDMLDALSDACAICCGDARIKTYCKACERLADRSPCRSRQSGDMCGSCEFCLMQQHEHWSES